MNDSVSITPIYAKLWEQTCSGLVWSGCSVKKAFAESRCYVPQEFDTFSFNDDCKRFCYAINQRIIPVIISDGFQNVYVSNPIDGSFNLTSLVDVTKTQELYYRVEGDREYVLFDKSSSSHQLVFNSATCNAKNVEIVLVNGPAPVNIAANPEAILLQKFLPIRTCFSVLCFKK